ncbi:hypothetical protein [Dongia sp.]|uniref:hypothetical protein n=1 Tax=Dongia sp. TaxID=1977262 RepID=UPI0035B249A8
MVGPEGQQSKSQVKDLDCQTSENRLIEAQELFARSSNPEPPDSERKSPDGPASTVEADLRNLGQSQNTPTISDDQAIWQEYTIVHRQPRTAVYWNTNDHVVIRQEPLELDEDDVVVTIDPAHLPALIERLKQMLEQVAI